MGNLVMAYAQQLNMTLEKGEDLYNQLMSIREDGMDLLICPEHIGDSIWIAAFVPDYNNTHECEKVYLVVKDSQNDILSRFPGVDGTVSISGEEMLDLRRYIYYTGQYHDNHIVFAHFHAGFFLNKDGFFIANMTDGIPCQTMTISRKAILGIPLDYEVHPQRMNTFDDGNSEELIELFSNAVLFCPTMQTQQGYIRDDFFEKLVKKYSDAGYDCYTNYNSFPYERMINGTKPLASSLQEFSVIAPYFKQVIAVRSGAADLLAQTEANLSVIYHHIDTDNSVDIYATPEEIGMMTVFALVNRNNMSEYVYFEDKEDELIEAVYSQIKELE